MTFVLVTIDMTLFYKITMLWPLALGYVIYGWPFRFACLLIRGGEKDQTAVAA